jgi:2,4-dienoyl-CoA reductase-like NADH-dependent reductase (Old Yellow Enzyme family)
MPIGGRTVGNRFCIQPMEGWDGLPDGTPSDLTKRRWQRFGRSGAKLIWGGEAAAVTAEGRANPHQLMATRAHERGLAELLDQLRTEHRQAFHDDRDLLVGLQLTHSGRYARPHRKDLAEPRIAYHHPWLDPRLGIDSQDDRCVFTDDQLDELISKFVDAACVARDVGFDFVDVKACHGYLLHELLSARTRTGKYGGDLAGRTRMLLDTIAAIRSACPELMIGVRLSLFDSVPFEQGQAVGQPIRDYRQHLPYLHGFGCDVDDPLRIDLTEPLELLQRLTEAGVAVVNLSCGSPYYTPHLQRPALFPPSDGYQPPEDPLIGVARQVDAVGRCKAALPHLPMVGSGYTYLQEFLPQVAQAVVRSGGVDFVGLGRMVLSYPELPADVLTGRFPQRKAICRTFSDCTSAPRQGFISGCYPLDPFYKERPERALLKPRDES